MLRPADPAADHDRLRLVPHGPGASHNWYRPVKAGAPRSSWVARVGGALAQPGEEPVGVGDVVGVGRPQPLLDDAPHRLAEVGHDPHEPDAGEVALAHAARGRRAGACGRRPRSGRGWSRSWRGRRTGRPCPSTPSRRSGAGRPRAGSSRSGGRCGTGRAAAGRPRAPRASPRLAPTTTRTPPAARRRASGRSRGRSRRCRTPRTGAASAGPRAGAAASPPPGPSIAVVRICSGGTRWPSTNRVIRIFSGRR